MSFLFINNLQFTISTLTYYNEYFSTHHVHCMYHCIICVFEFLTDRNIAIVMFKINGSMNIIFKRGSITLHRNNFRCLNLLFNLSYLKFFESLDIHKTSHAFNSNCFVAIYVYFLHWDTSETTSVEIIVDKKSRYWRLIEEQIFLYCKSSRFLNPSLYHIFQLVRFHATFRVNYNNWNGIVL